MSQNTSAYDATWSAIDREKRRDAVVRRTSIAAWAVTFVALLVFAAIMVQRFLMIQRRVAYGVAATFELYESMLPLVAVVGVLAVLIATLSTVGIFLRLQDGEPGRDSAPAGQSRGGAARRRPNRLM